jgi:hypothetical protein
MFPQLTLLFLLSCLPFTLGFVSPTTQFSVSETTTRRFVGISFDEDDDYFQLLKRAADCGNGEECSVAESEFLLNEVEQLSKVDSVVVPLSEMTGKLRQKILTSTDDDTTSRSGR